MSDTPETDHLEVQLGRAAMHSHPILWEHSRRMERERDEAIRKQDETNRSSKYACDYHYEEKLKAERERDESREIIRMAKAKFCEEGSDGNIASEMFSILNV